MWRTFNITNANPDFFISFNGRGSVFVDGNLDSGVVRLYVSSQDVNNGVKTYSTGFIYELNTSVKTADIPSGSYKFSLVGDNGSGDVTVYYADQKIIVS